MRVERFKRRREVGRERGAAMVELVIVIPVLVIMLFSIVEGGIAYNRQQALHAAAREGARVASIPSSNQADVNTAVTSALAGINFDAPPGAPTVSPGGCAGRKGETVTVTVNATFTFDVPLLFSTPLAMTGQGVFRCE